MAWVTWRQHRPQLLAAAGLVLAFAIAAIATSLPVHDAYHRQALSSCLPPSTSPGCDLLVAHFSSEFAWIARVGRYLFLLPGLALQDGEQLKASEIENGKYRQAWTQGVSRRRWLLSKTFLLAAAIVAAAAIVGAIAIWWRGPFDHIDGRIRPASFDVEGLVVPAYAFYALALGVLAGLFFRRTLAAISVAAGVFVATRVGVETLLRPHYLAPLHRAVIGTAPVGRTRDWLLHDTLVDAVGRRITTGREDIAVVHAQQANIDAQQYLASLGWRRLITFQPADRFWTFQSIEMGIFVTLGLLAIAAAVVLLHRRPA